VLYSEEKLVARLDVSCGLPSATLFPFLETVREETVLGEGTRLGVASIGVSLLGRGAFQIVLVKVGEPIDGRRCCGGRGPLVAFRIVLGEFFRPDLIGEKYEVLSSSSKETGGVHRSLGARLLCL
jgi:hypothetical protein